MPVISRSYAVVALVGLMAAGGCLRKDVIHTIYVSPSGVEWSAIERHVRSDEADLFQRMAEEQDYILGARAGRHGVARALRELGATRLETTILRADRPFTVVTAGRFGDLAALAAAMMKVERVRGDASIERDGCERTFRAWIDLENGPDEDSDALADLWADASSYNLVVTDGRFLRAEGFTIEEDGAIATPAPPAVGEDGVVRVSLTWSEGWCAPTAIRPRS